MSRWYSQPLSSGWGFDILFYVITFGDPFFRSCPSGFMNFLLLLLLLLLLFFGLFVYFFVVHSCYLEVSTLVVGVLFLRSSRAGLLGNGMDVIPRKCVVFFFYLVAQKKNNNCGVIDSFWMRSSNASFLPSFLLFLYASFLCSLVVLLSLHQTVIFVTILF
eukprot:TRINITY_DN7780_c0_g1_i1.p1 TRINITY_DN7780_c0_g1~~TRINITY_DN7780_c0_g1_i1.p1  ORF type:complete len:161 (+),score=6.92 TRINITY_DN7780_c0_g1_i1:381-863(+)